MRGLSAFRSDLTLLLGVHGSKALTAGAALTALVTSRIATGAASFVTTLLLFVRHICLFYLVYGDLSLTYTQQ
jgi:hypothetical protein